MTLSLHKYLYTEDEPINGLDPSGHITARAQDLDGSYINAEQLTVVTGGFSFQIQDTLDKRPTEDGYLIQEVSAYEDFKSGPLTKNYWEAFFIAGATNGSPPSVIDYQSAAFSDADKGKGTRHLKAKYYFKKTTGDLGGDYMSGPSQPHVNGWQAGDGKNWSMNLPWTEDANAVKPWWDRASDNGEKEMDIDINTAWEVGSLSRVVQLDTISALPVDLFTPL